MNRTLLALLTASLLFASQAHCQDPEQVAEAEFEVKMLGLEQAMSLHALDEAKVEVEQVLHHLRVAKQKGDSEQSGLAGLELKKAEIRVRMHELQAKVAQLKTERAKAQMQRLRSIPKKLAAAKKIAAAADQKAMPAKTKSATATKKAATPVKLEYVDDLDVIIVRGNKRGVDRIRALIEAAWQDKQEDQAEELGSRSPKSADAPAEQRQNLNSRNY